MEITKREILVSISIILAMLIWGFKISDDIADRTRDANLKYESAIKIDDSELFKYGMRTNVGNAFVYGTLSALDPVTFSEIGGSYMYISKTLEIYTQHTRTVTKTKKVNGKDVTYTEEEIYYSWDPYDTEELVSKNFTFLGQNFDSSKFRIPYESYIDTIYERAHERYVYYGVPSEVTGIIFTELKDGTISDNNYITLGSPEDAYNSYIHNETFDIALFWFCWVFLTGAIVYGFYYLDNNWLY